MGSLDSIDETLIDEDELFDSQERRFYSLLYLSRCLNEDDLADRLDEIALKLGEEDPEGEREYLALEEEILWKFADTFDLSPFPRTPLQDPELNEIRVRTMIQYIIAGLQNREDLSREFLELTTRMEEESPRDPVKAYYRAHDILTAHEDHFMNTVFPRGDLE